MKQYAIGFAAGIALCGVGSGAWVASASAQPAPQVECAWITVTKSNNSKWEEQISSWLAAGKTHFVTTPSGVCAY